MRQIRNVLFQDVDFNFAGFLFCKIKEEDFMFVSESMYELGSKRSAIKIIWNMEEEQEQLLVGAENVYDFSLGNPTVPAPDCVNRDNKGIDTEP